MGFPFQRRCLWQRQTNPSPENSPLTVSFSSGDFHSCPISARHAPAQVHASSAPMASTLPARVDDVARILRIATPTGRGFATPSGQNHTNRPNTSSGAEMPESGPHRPWRSSEVRRLTERLNVSCSPGRQGRGNRRRPGTQHGVPDPIRMCLEKQGIRISDDDFDLPRAHAG
jgi:hypothetical protein